MNKEGDIDDIKFCPVCGSEDIDKQLIKSINIMIDYYCNECGSNGDLDIYIKKEE